MTVTRESESDANRCKIARRIEHSVERRRHSREQVIPMERHAGVAPKHARQMKRRGGQAFCQRAQRPVLCRVRHEHDLRRIDDFPMARLGATSFPRYRGPGSRCCAKGRASRRSAVSSVSIGAAICRASRCHSDLRVAIIPALSGTCVRGKIVSRRSKAEASYVDMASSNASRAGSMARHWSPPATG